MKNEKPMRSRKTHPAPFVPVMRDMLQRATIGEEWQLSGDACLMLYFKPLSQFGSKVSRLRFYAAADRGHPYMELGFCDGNFTSWKDTDFGRSIEELRSRVKIWLNPGSVEQKLFLGRWDIRAKEFGLHEQAELFVGIIKLLAPVIRKWYEAEIEEKPKG